MTQIAHGWLGAGLHPDHLGLGQTALRAIVMYVAVLAIVRLGKKRFIARGSAFDVIVGIVIGSIAGRAITGTAPLSISMAGIATLVALHWLFSAVAVRSHAFGLLVKGRDQIVIRDGQVDEAALAHEHLSHPDLAEDLRKKGHADPGGVHEGRIERDGSLSLCTGPAPPRVVEVAVRDGVQTVRVEIG